MFEISGEEEVSVLEACMIEEDNMCEAYRVDDVVANDRVKGMFVSNTQGRMKTVARIPPH